MPLDLLVGALKRLKDLAPNTYAYFVDEPGHELAWYAL